MSADGGEVVSVWSTTAAVCDGCGEQLPDRAGACPRCGERPDARWVSEMATVVGDRVEIHAERDGVWAPVWSRPVTAEEARWLARQGDVR